MKDEQPLSPVTALTHNEEGLPPVNPSIAADLSSFGISVEGLDAQRVATGSKPQHNAFTIERKSEFLRLAIEHWPNLAKIARSVGVDPATVWHHRRVDPVFNKALHDIDQMVCDEHEEILRQEGMKPKGFLDRMAYLRAHRPELYNPTKRIIVEGYKMSSSEAKDRLSRAEGAIEAQIVRAYADRQERKRIKLDGPPEVIGGDQVAGGEPDGQD